jgi:hypothetical protein
MLISDICSSSPSQYLCHGQISLIMYIDISILDVRSNEGPKSRMDLKGCSGPINRLEAPSGVDTDKSPYRMLSVDRSSRRPEGNTRGTANHCYGSCLGVFLNNLFPIKLRALQKVAKRCPTKIGWRRQIQLTEVRNANLCRFLARFFGEIYREVTTISLFTEEDSHARRYPL